MSLAGAALKNRTVTYFASALLVIGGIAGYFNLAQLEDPEFTVKTAVVATPYPGASPLEVEQEVTDRIEQAIQEMGEVKYIDSNSRAGLSTVKVEILPQYWSDDLPQIWDMLRRKAQKVIPQLPPGAGPPQVHDDYGDVYGLQLALVGDGFDYAEMERWAKVVRRELSVVKGVGRVDLWGVQKKVIYLDVKETRMTQRGLSDANIVQTLQKQNMVVDAGSLDLETRRFRIQPSGEFTSTQAIADLTIHPTLFDTLQTLTRDRRTGGGGEEAPGGVNAADLIRLGDIGTVRRGYAEPPANLMRHNGRPAIGLSITNVAGSNVVEVGQAVDARIESLASQVPVGIELKRVHWMSDVVSEAVDNFLISFLEALGIVLVVLAVFMGWRMGVIIGTALAMTILGSFVVMAVLEIPLQRMSLGALIIALGMMVDNAIVVADGIMVRFKQGMDRYKAAEESARRPAWPLLGATVVAVMAFYPIAGSPEGTGEYCQSLFWVVAISLLISWVISMTLTPLQCIDMLPHEPGGKDDADPYGGKLFQRFRGLLQAAIRRRALFMLGMVGLLVLAVLGFGQVKQLFFPASSMTKFMVDFWFPEGTRIQQVSDNVADAEKFLRADPRVVSVAAFVGQGPPRFYLPVEPEQPYQAYAQLIVNVKELKQIDGLMDELRPRLQERYPSALIPVRKYNVGPGKTWEVEVRVIGPPSGDPAELRAQARKFADILDNNPLAAYVRTDWRQRVLKVVPRFDEKQARWTAVTREDLAHTTKRAYDGLRVGLYREGDDLTPIVLRYTDEYSQRLANLDNLQVRSPMSTAAVPLSQVTEEVALRWEDPIIWRWNRARAIKVQSNPVPGVTTPTLVQSVMADFDAVELPPGYHYEWGGIHESSRDSQQGLLPGLIPALAVMALIIVVLFNAYRPPLIILLTIPFAAIGITLGLLAFDVPFGFMALLGAMSLMGMMIKNAIVLLDEINANLAAGKKPYDAVMESALSRLRPVALAAATTVLGVIPLLQDVFWVGLAVTIMAGLAFGTILTMVVIPVLYCILFRIKSPQASG